MVYQHILELIRHGIPCAFHLLTGFYCPGCGGTRAVVYLLQGQIGRSFQYHPLIPYMAAVLVLEFGSWGLSRLLGRPGLHIKRYDFFVYLGIAVILVNWLVKNYCLVVLGIDLLPGRL